MPSSRTPTPTCGHVFILRCSNTGLAADAILLPDQPSAKSPISTGSILNSKTHVFEMPPLPSGDLSKAISTATTAVTTFLSTAATTVTSSSFRRDHPLLAFPILEFKDGSRKDAIQMETALVNALLPITFDVADKHSVDIAVCTSSKTAYAMLQLRREKLCPFLNGPFWMLSEEMKAKARDLAAKARAGSLSVFFGAGVSYPSGLPSWGGLLEELAVKAGFDEEERKALGDLGYLDRPTLMEERMGRAKFCQTVADLVSGGKYTPAHAILAELRVTACTTNYDDLFERAAIGGVVNRLPWDSNAVSEASKKKETRCVTKLHGCVSHPRTIVLTRKDYLRYGDKKQALRGVVQSMLLTTHVMFVGFSMTDDNLHLIIDESRECLEGKSGKDPKGVFGTILSLKENEMFRNLWDQDFDVVTCGKTWDDNPAWVHDCFLDCLGNEVAGKKKMAGMILDENFENFLTAEEKTIRELLQPLLDFVKKDKKIKKSPVWGSVEALLEELGANV